MAESADMISLQPFVVVPQKEPSISDGRKKLIWWQSYLQGVKAQYLAAILASLSAFSLGNSFAWTSSASTPLRNGTYIHCIFVTSEQEAWIAANFALSAGLSAIPLGIFMDYYGRKKVLLVLVVPLAIGWCLLTWPFNLECVYGARFLLGLAAGGSGVIVPVYIAEIAEHRIRGALGSYFEIMLTLGITFCYVVGSLVPPSTLSLCCLIVSLTSFLLFSLMPETPLFLIKKGYREDARHALLFLRNANVDVNSELVELEERVQRRKEMAVSIWDELTKRPVQRGLVISLGLMTIQQLSGISPITFFLKPIFEATGSWLNADICSILFGFSEVLATLISSFIVDKIGRRPLLLWTTFGMYLSLILLGLFFHFKAASYDVSFLSFLPLITLCTFITSFAFGLGPIPWIMVGELFPPEVQGPASGAASMVNWFVGFVVSKFYVDIVAILGNGGTYFLFAGFLILGSGYIGYFAVETKGKTLKEIQVELSS